MNRQHTFSLLTVFAIATGLGAEHVSAQSHTTAPAARHRVAYQAVQRTPQYDLRRPEVVSGAQVSLFGNFLGSQPGIVLFQSEGISTECSVIDWRDRSVSVQLPRFGLAEPKNAEIQIVLPDGRIAKTFRVLVVAPPDIVIHEESVPVPLPPVSIGQPASYVTPVQGGLVLSAAG